MNYILFDDATRLNLLPLSFTRPVADIRFGILTIREKWERMLNAKTSTLTDEYLSKKFPIFKQQENILINGSISPDSALVEAITKLKPNQSLVYEDIIIAYRMDDSVGDKAEASESLEPLVLTQKPLKIDHLWDIFQKNDIAISNDFELITKGRKSQTLSNTNKIIGNGKIFIEEGVKAECVIFNTTPGPIYLGKNAEIMEGSAIRGPFAVGEEAVIKMNTKIYGPTTIGPYSRVGGEINSCVIFGYSNKAHDGFLGHSVIGEWCNLGADTNNSNLKNTYDEVKLWNYPLKKFISTGLQFCGLIMGDHSKSGINTMFNTGTVVGVFSNVFGSGFQRNFVPSFMWGGTAGLAPYDLKKAMIVADRVMQRRNLSLTEYDKEILTEIYNLTIQYKYLKQYD